MTDVTLKWHGTPIPDLELQIVAEIRDLLAGGLPNASRLILHHVFIGDYEDGPVVKVWGEENDPAFHCEFQTKMSDDFTFDLEEFKGAPWYETIKKHWEAEDK